MVVISFGSYSQQFNQTKYTWKNVKITGGGFVDGIIFHPAEKGLCYARTDMGGAYRRDSAGGTWVPLLDWLSYEDVNLMGVESIALDPNNPNMLYMACGTYTNPNAPNGAILWSDDKGKSFQRTDLPFKLGANEDGRGNGERMMVDPVNGNIIYLGTRHDGLWRSTDKALSWQKVTSFPDMNEMLPSKMKDQDSIRIWRRTNTGAGIIFVLYSPGSATQGKSNTIYAGISLMNCANIYKSTDGGETWNALPGLPIAYMPTHASLSPDGFLYITYGDRPGPSRMIRGAVWKYNTSADSWTDITPDKPMDNREFGYAAVTLDATNPDIVMVSTYHRYQVDNGEDIFRSVDGGKTWKQVFGSGGKLIWDVAPYTKYTAIHWLFDIEIDPYNPDHAIFTTGYGGYETFNLTDIDDKGETFWKVMADGIEETVALDMLSPPKGSHLVSAIGDYAGFVHWDLNVSGEAGYFKTPRFNNTNSVDCAYNKPEIIVRTGRPVGENPGQSIAYSTNGGESWQSCESLPFENCQSGDISVSAIGSTWVWMVGRTYEGNGRNWKVVEKPSFYTENMGKTWYQCEGLPPLIRVTADKVNNNKFYAYNILDEYIYISENGGRSFIQKKIKGDVVIPKSKNNRGDVRGGQDLIYTTPEQENDLWLAAFDGLYHTTDTSFNFVKMGNVTEIHAFGFGKAVPGNNYPCLYLVGIVNGVRGVFRSNDIAKTWIRINNDQHQWGMILHITGDPKRYGRVYVGTHGRGIVYGDPWDFVDGK